MDGAGDQALVVTESFVAGVVDVATQVLASSCTLGAAYWLQRRLAPGDGAVPGEPTFGSEPRTGTACACKRSCSRARASPRRGPRPAAGSTSRLLVGGRGAREEPGRDSGASSTGVAPARVADAEAGTVVPPGSPHGLHGPHGQRVPGTLLGAGLAELVPAVEGVAAALVAAWTLQAVSLISLLVSVVRAGQLGSFVASSSGTPYTLASLASTLKTLSYLYLGVRVLQAGSGPGRLDDRSLGRPNSRRRHEWHIQATSPSPLLLLTATFWALSSLGDALFDPMATTHMCEMALGLLGAALSMVTLGAAAVRLGGGYGATARLWEATTAPPSAVPAVTAAEGVIANGQGPGLGLARGGVPSAGKQSAAPTRRAATTALGLLAGCAALQASVLLGALLCDPARPWWVFHWGGWPGVWVLDTLLSLYAVELLRGSGSGGGSGGGGGSGDAGNVTGSRVFTPTARRGSRWLPRGLRPRGSFASSHGSGSTGGGGGGGGGGECESVGSLRASSASDHLLTGALPSPSYGTKVPIEVLVTGDAFSVRRLSDSELLDVGATHAPGAGAGDGGRKRRPGLKAPLSKPTWRGSGTPAFPTAAPRRPSTPTTTPTPTRGREDARGGHDMGEGGGEGEGAGAGAGATAEAIGRAAVPDPIGSRGGASSGGFGPAADDDYPTHTTTGASPVPASASAWVPEPSHMPRGMHELLMALDDAAVMGDVEAGTWMHGELGGEAGGASGGTHSCVPPVDAGCDDS